MSFVYLIQNCHTGEVKIGSSKNPRKRLKQLQTGNSNKLVLLHQIFCEKKPAKHLEKRMQSWFNKGSLKGEWRLLTDEDLDWLLSFNVDRDLW